MRVDGKVAIETAGGSALPVAADVAGEDNARRYVAETIVTFGRLDIMINNAGVIAAERALETSVESWERCTGHVTTTPMWDFIGGELARITGETILVDGGLVRF